MATLGSKAFANLRVTVQKASRGTVSGYVLNAPRNFGQPVLTSGDAYGLISPKRQREIMLKSPTATACLNAIVDFSSSVKVGVRNVDPAVPAPASKVARVNRLLKKPNSQDTWETFMRAWLKDVITFGYAAVEMTFDATGGVAALYVVDGERIRVDYDEHGTISGFDMVNVFGVPITAADGIHAWKPNEMLWFRLDPDSSTPYGKSRSVQLYANGILETMMLAFIGGRFTDSNIPFGVMDIGDVSQEELDFAIESWNEQAQQAGDHRLMITGSKGGAKWLPFGYHLKDLDATNLLNLVRRQITGILGVTMNELGESQDINKANGYNLSYVFKKRAIEPVLRCLTTTLTEFLLHDQLGFTDLELYFDEIDSRDELLQAQIDDLYTKIGVWSPNHIRNRKGLPSEPGGDDTFFFTGRDWIPLRLLASFAEAQLQSLWLVNAQILQGMQMVAAGGTQTTGPDGQASITPPKVPVPALPDGEQIPGTIGHSGPRIKFPQASTSIKPPAAGQSKTAPRGPVQTLRNEAGVRKEG